MIKYLLSVFITFLLLLSITGCTNATPEIESLNSLNSLGITFYGKPDTSLNINSSPVTVTGECDQRTISIKISTDNGKTWITPPDNASNDLDCADKSFVFVIQNPLIFLEIQAGTASTTTLLIRSDFKNLSSNPSRINFTYDPTSVTPPITMPPITTFPPDNSNVVLTQITPAPPYLNSLSPMIQVTGLSAGDIIKIYSNLASCISLDSNNWSITSTGNSESILLTGLTENTNYSFYERSFNTNNQYSDCSSSFLTYTPDVTPPGAFSVTGIRGASDTTSDSYLTDGLNPKVDWSVSTDASSYSIVILNTDNSIKCPWVSGQVSNNYLFSSCNLTDGSSYKAKVAAFDLAGNSIDTTDFPFTVDVTLPTTPTSLALHNPATSPGNSINPTIRVTVSLNNNDNVYLYTNSDCSSSVYGTATASGSVSFLDVPVSTSLTNGSSYTFYAKTSDSVMSSACSTAFVNYTVYASTISVDNPTVIENDGSSQLVFTVTASELSNANITFNYATIDNTATTADGDYTAQTGVGTITSGSTTTTISVPITNDSKYEDAETINLTLSSGSGYSVSGSTLNGVGTISNDDPMPSVRFNSSTQTVSENIGTVIVTAQLSAVSGVTTTIPFTISGTATTSVDYSISPSSLLTIPAGSTSATIILSVNDDSLAESTETVVLTMDTPTNASFGAISNFTLTINDNDLSVEPVYASNSNWNDYVKYSNSAVDSNHQNDTACDGSETGYYGELNGCIHGGERRKVVVSSRATCSLLTIADNGSNPSTNIFDWQCQPDGGFATFYTKGFAKGKGLRDLLTAPGLTASWKSMQVTLFENGFQVAQSPFSNWWSNALINLNSLDNSSTTSFESLNLAGAIYYVANEFRPTYGYNIGADKISIVTLGSGQLRTFKPTNPRINCLTASGAPGSFAGNEDTIICGGSRNFLWIESNIDGVTSSNYAANTGIYAYNWKYSRIHNTTVSPMNSSTINWSINLNNSNSNLITNLNLYDISSGFGLLGNSQLNTVKNISIGKITTYIGIYIGTNSFGNRFFDTRVSNTLGATYGYGIYIMGNNNSFSRTTVFNSRLEGIFFESNASNNIFSQLISSSNGDSGIYFYGNNINNIFANYTSLNNTYNSVYFTSGSYSNNLFVSTAMGNDGSAIVESVNNSSNPSGFNNRFIDTFMAEGTNAFKTYQSGLISRSGLFITNSGLSCLVSGDPGFCSSPTPTSSSALLTDAFTGKVTTTDSANNQNFNGASSSITTLSGTLSFENWLRGWGMDGTFPGLTTQGFASSAFRIWDLHANPSGPIHNISSSGFSQNGFSGSGYSINTDNSSCISNTVSPTDTITNAYNAGSITFLRNAIEIDGDEIGNDNGLCEANEDCIWAPNLGAYQGEGVLSTGYCTIDDGAGGGLDGIRVFKHTFN